MVNGDMTFFWTFLSMLQIVVYMPIIKVNLPPNTEIFLESMRHVAEFELFDSHSLLNALSSALGIPEHENTDPNAEEYKGAGFSSLEFEENMGYIFFIIGLFLFILLATGIMSVCNARAKKLLQKIKKRWVWSYTLRTISVIYLFTLVSYGLASKVNSLPFKITVGVVLAAYPIWTTVFLFYYRDSLIERANLEKYWGLYGNLRFKDQAALLYPLISCTRKWLYVMGTLYLSEWSYFQV